MTELTSNPTRKLGQLALIKFMKKSILLSAIFLSAVTAYSQGPDFVSVKTYGAKGDGTSEDTNAIQAAISSGNSVYFPAGVYKVSGTLTLSSNHMYVGASRGSSIIKFTSQDQTIIEGGNSSNVAIKSLSILGNAQTPTSNLGIHFGSGSTRNVIDDVEVEYMFNIGIQVAGTQNTISNSFVENCRYGISIGGDQHTIKNNYVSNHYSTVGTGAGSLYWDGIVSEGLTNSLIEGNTAEDNGQSGIYTGGNGSVSYNNRIVNNYVAHNFNRGIDQGVSGDVTASNSLGKLTIVGNTAIDNKEANIWLNQVSGASVSGNYVEYTSAYPTFFGQNANPNRVGVALAEIGGSGSTLDATSNVTLVGNTVIDYAGASKICISFAVLNGKNNTVAANSANCAIYTPAGLNAQNNNNRSY